MGFMAHKKPIREAKSELFTVLEYNRQEDLFAQKKIKGYQSTSLVSV